MKKLLTLLAATAAVSLLPSLSQAACVANGEISRISVDTAASFFVRNSDPGSVSVLFTTSNSLVIDAALNAQASHEHVQVTGSAAACGVAVGGRSNGGTVTLITMAQ